VVLLNVALIYGTVMGGGMMCWFVVLLCGPGTRYVSVVLIHCAYCKCGVLCGTYMWC
jgi:hypothetical protein